MMIWTEETVLDTIRTTILYEGLELDGLGVNPDDLTGETMLLAEEGLSLDSVDALEIIVGVQKVFGLSIPDLDTAFFENNLRTVRTLADYVVSALELAPETA